MLGWISLHSDFLAIFGCNRVNRNKMDGYQDYLRTGTAIGSHAFHEH